MQQAFVYFVYSCSFCCKTFVLEINFVVKRSKFLVSVIKKKFVVIMCDARCCVRNKQQKILLNDALNVALCLRKMALHLLSKRIDAPYRDLYLMSASKGLGLTLYHLHSLTNHPY